MLALYKGPHTDYPHYINITIMDYSNNKDRQPTTTAAAKRTEKQQLLVRIVEKEGEIASEEEVDKKVKYMLELRANVHSNALANIIQNSGATEKKQNIILIQS